MRRRGTSLILEAIEPSRKSVDAAELRYPNLREALRAFGPMSYLQRGGRLIKHPLKKMPKPGKLRQELNTAYLLTASYRLQKSLTPVDKIFWSKQFTLASVGLFGRPNPRQVRVLAAAELRYFESLVDELDNHHEFTRAMLHYYRLLAGNAKSTGSLEKRFGKLLVQVRDYFYDRYGSVLAVFDELPANGELEPIELRRYFRRALKQLAAVDPDWVQWQVVSNQSAGLSVEAPKKQIVIGRYRAPVHAKDVRGLFAHEVLVHAKRAVGGAKLSKALAEGLPDYLEAEEGLGVLAEAALGDGIPSKIKDRYLDIALAMGNYRRRAVNREQLFNVCYVRAVLRSLDRGFDLDLDDLENQVWQHVNRIYRGSLGDKYVAVFTKDIAYYQGFIRMAKYLKVEAKQGRLTSSLDLALSAKFDPTSISDVRQVKSLTKNK
ncbi:MAG TPA: tyrosine/phenylalanine carboxypeptidase domain-containing protein [Candidatus Saccharimonadales bacterium]|nr:tyrosine/phenylalanine carboxypeptidase domain-containing protein [Candidatus Saccharimonadales bacterium]